jgi:hypothetical protein
MLAFRASDWSTINGLRERIMARQNTTVMEGAQHFTEEFAQTFSSLVLARVFLIVPWSAVPTADRDFGRPPLRSDKRLEPKTRVLSLLGTAGVDPRWRDRSLSQGHLVVPLLDRTHVEEIPMIAKLLADLEVDFAALDDGRPIATRRMLGGRNGTFFVPDAQTAADDRGRFVIPSRDFVTERGIRTVFGMAGAYANGTLAVAIVFTNEIIARETVDRFPSLISNFKMATAALLESGAIYAPPSRA